jgi:outer membrane protein, heavy metal efflux system
MTRSYLLFILFFFVGIIYGQGQPEPFNQDSVSMTMQQVEDSFLIKNLALIAQKYSIDSARATVITAKLYNNPEVDYQNELYDQLTHGLFGAERSFQVSELITMARKRNKAIQLATSGIEIAEDQFYDLLRTLRFVVRNDFYNIYFMEQSAKLYQLEISSLKNLVPVFEGQVQKGYMAADDAIRIKSQLYTLQAEFDGLQTNIEEVQSELKFLIRAGNNVYIIPMANVDALAENNVAKTSYQDLIDTAIADRPDLKSLNAGIAFSQNNLTLQKALAVPDISVEAAYDRYGSYVHNYNSIGIGLPIPLFNRNQGNIKNAQIQLEVSKVNYENGIDQVKNEVTTNYITALRSEKLLMSFDPKFEQDLRQMIDQVLINFEKKNITMLEFLDYYDSYKQNILQINQLRYNKMNALEQLNFSIGKIFFNR